MKTVAKRKVVNEEPTIISTEALDALVVKLDPVEVAGSLLTLETGSVQLPDLAALRHVLTGAGDFVDIEVLFIMTYLLSTSWGLLTSLRTLNSLYCHFLAKLKHEKGVSQPCKA